MKDMEDVLQMIMEMKVRFGAHLTIFSYLQLVHLIILDLLR